MGGKGGSAAPAPDYTAAANATAAGNLEAARAATAANRLNQVTPYGNLTYTQNVQDTFNKDAYQTALNAYNTAKQTYVPQYGETGELLNPSEIIAPNYQDFITKGNPDGGWLATTSLNEIGQKLLDNQNNASLGLGSVINASLGDVQNTMSKPFVPNTPAIQYGGQAPTLNTQGATPAEFQKMQEAAQLQSQLGNSGMAGWDRAQGILNQRLQPQLQIQNEQLDTKLRNQGIMPGTEAYNRSKAALGMQQNDLINQSQLTAQQIGGNLFNQDLQAGQFGNQALTQQNTNQLANAGFNNQQNQQQFNNQLANQQAQNSAMNQGFANQQALANMNNQGQQQAFNQQMTQYNMPLNTLSALRSGSQVQNPSFVNSFNQATTQGADLLGAATAQGNANQAAANASAASGNSMTSGLMGLAGTAMMAF